MMGFEIVHPVSGEILFSSSRDGTLPKSPTHVVEHLVRGHSCSWVAGRKARLHCLSDAIIRAGAIYTQI